MFRYFVIKGKKERTLLSKEQMIDSLNQDLAHELCAIIQYLTYAAKVTGPNRPQLSQFFLAEVPDEQLHAEETERILRDWPV